MRELRYRTDRRRFSAAHRGKLLALDRPQNRQEPEGRGERSRDKTAAPIETVARHIRTLEQPLDVWRQRWPVRTAAASCRPRYAEPTASCGSRSKRTIRCARAPRVVRGGTTETGFVRAAPYRRIPGSPETTIGRAINSDSTVPARLSVKEHCTDTSNIASVSGTSGAFTGEDHRIAHAQLSRQVPEHPARYHLHGPRIQRPTMTNFACGKRFQNTCGTARTRTSWPFRSRPAHCGNMSGIRWTDRSTPFCR